MFFQLVLSERFPLLQHGRFVPKGKTMPHVDKDVARRSDHQSIDNNDCMNLHALPSTRFRLKSRGLTVMKKVKNNGAYE